MCFIKHRSLPVLLKPVLMSFMKNRSPTVLLKPVFTENQLLWLSVLGNFTDNQTAYKMPNACHYLVTDNPKNLEVISLCCAEVINLCCAEVISKSSENLKQYFISLLQLSAE